MAEAEKGGAGSRYHIGDVAAGARVQQGQGNTWAENAGATPGGEELRRKIEDLVARIASERELDEDSRALAIEKTQAVAAALGQARESPDGLRRAVRDAQVFLGASLGWAWDALRGILSSEPAQRTISTIAEVGARAAIQGLIGGS